MALLFFPRAPGGYTYDRQFHVLKTAFNNKIRKPLQIRKHRG